METEALIVRTWDDLVFRSRNREYGAYLIRKAYGKRVMLGAGISVAFLVGFLIFSGLASKVAPVAVPPFTRDEGTARVLPKPEIEQPQKQQPKPPIKTNNTNTTVQVVTTPVEPVEPVQTDNSTSTNTVEGTEGGGIIDGAGTTTIEIPIVIDKNEPLVTAEVMPAYAGGTEAMFKFIRRNIKYPSAPRKLGIEGTVFVSFVVGGDGTVYDVKVLRGIHQKCDEEAVRVISMLNKWTGGKQNGNPVAVKMVLPITFKLSQ
jgi:periplasmic protein TonB